MAKHEEEEEAEAGERWLVSYADMMTLLVALFIVLFAMADVNAAKFDALKESLNGHPEVAEAILKGSTSVIDGGAPQKLDDTQAQNAASFDLPSVSVATENLATSQAAKQALQSQQAAAKAAADEAATLEGVQEEIQASLKAAGLQDAVKFTRDSKGLTITIVTDQVLFNSGDAKVLDGAKPILDALGPPLSKVANDISVEGYTDSNPISTPAYPSNWELSTARATSVLRYLVEREGVQAGKIGATGYGQERAAVPNDTDAHKAQNRRVEVVVLATNTNGATN